MSLYSETITDEVCRNCYNNETGRSMCPICRGVGFRVVREEVTINYNLAYNTAVSEGINILPSQFDELKATVDAALAAHLGDIR